MIAGLRRLRHLRWVILLIWTVGFSVLGIARVHAQGQIDPRFGHLVLTISDLTLQAGPVTLELQRALETRPDHQGLLGNRWTSNWESRVVSTPTAVVVDEVPYAVAFTRAGATPEYQSASGERLVIHSDGRFVRTRLSGTTETFDNQGRLVERDYRNGNKAIVRYGANGRIARIDGPRGSFVQFSADNQGRLTRIETSSGATLRYAYVGDNLTEVQVSGGPAVRYGYDSSGALTRIDDPRSGAVALAYDAYQRVVSRRWADGAEERFEYDDAARAQRRIDPAGAVTVTRFDEDGRRAEVTDPRGGKTVVTFDANGRAESVTGPSGGTAKTIYDSLGRPAAFHDPYGQVTRYEYLGATGRVKTIARPDGTQESLTYDPQQNVTEIKLGPQSLATLAYHRDGTVSAAKALGVAEQRFTYDGQARLQTLTNPLGERLQWSYDARGNPLRAVNPLGGVTAWQWNAQDQLLSETDPIGATTRYEYDSSGRLARVIDPLGGVTRFEYDVRGRLVAETDPSEQVTRYEYDRAGRLAKLSEGGASENFRYDASGNLIEWVDRLGRTVQIERDLLGRVTQERASTGQQMQYRYDARGQLGAMEDPRAGKLELQRDERGQVIAMRDAQGATTQFQYDALGNVTGRRDPRGQLKQFGYTGEGTLARVQEPSGDAAEYRYDAANRLVEIMRPSGGRSRFSYNGLGNLTQEIDPLGHERRSQYDVAGRLVASTDATGRTTRYTYDAAGRLIEKRFADGKRVTFKYDSVGNLLEADDGAFPVRYQYDREGRRVKVEYPAIKKAVGYEYNAEGLRTKLIAPDGRETRYEYDGHKELAATIPPDGKPIALGYDAQERLQSIRYPNGLTGTWEYDMAGRVAKLAYVHSSGKPISAWIYHYDPDGNLLRQQDTEGRGTTYSYDAAGQLTEAAGSAGAVRYRYGAGGRRLSMEAAAGALNYRHDSADRLIEAGPEKLTYDANGNLARRERPGETTSYEYDAEDGLVKVQGIDGKTTTFGYAPTGERVWKRDADGLTYYLYDGLDLIQELDDKGNVKAAYVHGPGIDQPLVMLREGKSFYYHADRLGSVRALTDQSGGVAAMYDYDAFGKLETTRGAVPNPFTYTGREWDASIGLYYYRARYYDPALGRFLSPDPLPAALDKPLEHNAYLYVRNNPLGLVDPLGLNGNQADPYNLPRFADTPHACSRCVPPEGARWRAGPPLSVSDLSTDFFGNKYNVKVINDSPVRVLSGLDMPEGMTVREWNEQIKATARTWAARSVSPPPGIPARHFEGSPEEVTIRFGRPSAPTPGLLGSGGGGTPPPANVRAPSAGTVQVPRPVVPAATGAAVVEGEVAASLAAAEGGAAAGLRGRLPSASTVAKIGGAIALLPALEATKAAVQAEPGQRLAAAGESLGKSAGGLWESGKEMGRWACAGAVVGGCIGGPPGALIGAKIGAAIPVIKGTVETLVEIPKAIGALRDEQDKLDKRFGPPLPPGGLDGTQRSPSATDGPPPPTTTPQPGPVTGSITGGLPGAPPFDPRTAQTLPKPKPEQIAAAQGLAGQTDRGLPPIVPPGKQKEKTGDKQARYQDPPAIDVTQGPRDKPPAYVDTCPHVDQAGKVLVWVPCPQGVFPGTPLTSGGPSVWCRRASGEPFAIPMYPCPPNTTPSPPPTTGAPQPSGPTTSRPPPPGVPPPMLAGIGVITAPPGSPPGSGPAPPTTPPVKPPVTQPTPPATPPAQPATGAQCSPPLCREMSYENCKRTSGSQTCGGMSASLPSCFGPKVKVGDTLSDDQLAQLTPEKVQAACYQNMLKRCKEGEAGRTGGYCVGKGKDPSCEARAQRSCG